jgi:hypothetical protein
MADPAAKSISSADHILLHSGTTWSMSMHSPAGLAFSLDATPQLGRKEDLPAPGGVDGVHFGASAGNRDLRAKELNS